MYNRVCQSTRERVSVTLLKKEHLRARSQINICKLYNLKLYKSLESITIYLYWQSLTAGKSKLYGARYGSHPSVEYNANLGYVKIHTGRRYFCYLQAKSSFGLENNF